MSRPIRLLLAAATTVAAAFFALPAGSPAYALIGGSLGITNLGYQRDVRVFNNAADPSANDNQTPSPAHPGALGAVQAVWRATQAWNSNTAGKNFDFDFQGEATNDGGTNGNVVSWGNVSCGGGTLAWMQGPISDGWKIQMCENWVWSDGPGNPVGSQVDIQGIAAHELGHALGLDHSNVSCGTCSISATMCAFVCGSGTAERTLQADDLAGLEAIYGAKPANKPTITGLSGSFQVGGQLVIQGTNFPAVANVKFTAGTTQNTGSIPGVVFNVPSSAGGTQMVVTIPSTARDGNVLIWAPGSNLLSNPFPIDIGALPPQPPVLSTVQPGTTRALGGEVITLIGSSFTGATQVTIAGNVLTPPFGFTVVDDNTITFQAPKANALGPAQITVTTPIGTSAPGAVVYVPTSPLTLIGPLFLLNGGPATYSWGGQPGRTTFMSVSVTGQTVPYKGTSMLVAQLFLALPPTNAAGLGSITAPINGALAGTNVFVQIITVAPPGTDLSTVELSNISQAQVLF